MTYYTIAIDGDIGYFRTYYSKHGAETEAAKWQSRPDLKHHTYTVVEEDPTEAEYAEQYGTVLP